MENVDVVLSREILDPYTERGQLAMRQGIRKTARDMVKETKATAPRGRYDYWKSRGFNHSRTPGTFSAKQAYRGRGSGAHYSATWYVKAPEYRLTHLLAHGHQLFIYGRNAHRRTASFPWLQEARDRAEKEVVPNIVKELSRP